MQETRPSPEGKDARRAPRIEPLATLPVFFKLEGKRAVVAGGSEAALWKAELLAAAGADVGVYAESFAEGYTGLAAAPPAGSVTLNPRSWRPSDLEGAAIAVAAARSDEEAAAFAAAARAAGVPVNVIDRPAFCDFQFGAIVNRSPLVVAISTDGAAPVLGQAIRSRIEILLPDGLRRWTAAALSWRRRGGSGGGKTESRGFWERFADVAMREAHRPPAEADFERLAEPVPGEEKAAEPVAIIIVSAESTETMTLAAVNALRGADAIFYDPRTPRAAFDFARREADRSPFEPGPQAATIDKVVAEAARGRRVVILEAAAADAQTLAAALRSASLPCVIHAGQAPS